MTPALRTAADPAKPPWPDGSGAVKGDPRRNQALIASEQAAFKKARATYEETACPTPW